MSSQNNEILIEKIAKIEATANEIKKQREEYNRNVISIANKRNLLNEKVKELIKSAKEDREKRDRFNNLIKEKKDQKKLIFKFEFMMQC